MLLEGGRDVVSNAGPNEEGRSPADMPMCHDHGHARAALLGLGPAASLGSMNTQLVEPPGPLTEVSWEIPAAATAPSAARALVRQAAEVWGLPGLAADLALCVSELATNAVVHGAGPVTVRLCRQSSAAVLCEVADTGGWVPQSYESNPLAENGRGLALVATVASVFGARPGGCHGECNGKTVWFCLGGEA
jgi:anti-sigma regulatory factor (Ser/Thr protein kinase)